ncbi:OmpH family outer membrane protein [uncultured Cytophaga sp.]|uniref:OmpH family outer membrane protein n=1 Tax=uncultured Cytophaga sp. TaxID=160238 RepID=UPI00262FD916|nr:OmpH family outer membrane protein [uncultured Cytophaga sp.]
MNQRISLLINGVLAIAVIILFILHFQGQKAQVANVAVGDSTIIVEDDLVIDSLPNLGSNNGAIAFIDFEELTKKYQFYKDGISNLENDFKRKETEFAKKQKTYEENVGRYQQLAQSLAPEVREKREKDLMQEEQTLLELRDRLRSDLADKEENFNKNFLKKLDEYLKVLSKEKNYSYVFTYVKGNPATIVYAKDTLNISSQVIEALNQQYKNKK